MFISSIFVGWLLCVHFSSYVCACMHAWRVCVSLAEVGNMCCNGYSSCFGWGWSFVRSSWELLGGGTWYHPLATHPPTNQPTDPFSIWGSWSGQHNWQVAAPPLPPPRLLPNETRIVTSHFRVDRKWEGEEIEAKTGREGGEQLEGQGLVVVVEGS